MKKYINMVELMEEIKKRSATEIYSENKIREKILELFKVMNVNTEYLQDGRKPTGEYRFPKESVDFLCYLYDFYTTTDGKNFRRGEFEKIDISIIRNIISNMMDMLKKCELTREEISEQEIIIWQATRFIYLNIRDKIRRQIDSTTLDFFPQTKEMYGRLSGNPEHPVVQNKSRFRYSLTDLDLVDMYYFYEYVLQDMKENQNKYRKIYTNMVEIRNEEISESAYQVDSMFDEGDYDRLRDNVDKTADLFIMLYKDPEYDKLSERHYKLIHSNEFLKKRDKELLEIEARMNEIEKEYIDKHFKGEINDEIDEKFEIEFDEKDPEIVLNEAIIKYKEDQARIERIAAMIDKKILELEGESKDEPE